MPTLARARRLHQQGVGRGQRREPGLQAEQRGQRAHLRAGRRVCQDRLHLAGQFAGERHPPALPARHRSLALARDAHVRGHVLELHQLQRAAGELKAGARPQPRHEGLFHHAQVPALEEPHLHAAVAGDGADGQPVAKGDAALVHAVCTVLVAYHAPVVGIRLQRAAAADDEVQHRLPRFHRQAGEGVGAAHFRQQRVRLEAPAEGERHAVLGEHVEREARRRARLDAPGGQRLPGGGILRQFQSMGWNTHHMPGLARAMACAAAALEQARHALRAADLQYLVHRGEIDAQVEAGSGHHAAHAAIAQALLGGGPQAGVE